MKDSEKTRFANTVDVGQFSEQDGYALLVEDALHRIAKHLPQDPSKDPGS